METLTPGIWRIEDGRRPPAVASSEAQARAVSGNWSPSFKGSSGSPVDDFRWLGVSTVGAMVLLQGPGQNLNASPWTVGQYPDADHDIMAQALAGTFDVLGQLVEPGFDVFAKRTKSYVWKVSGSADTFDAGTLPPILLAAIAISVVGRVMAVGAACYFGAQVVNNALARREDTARMVQQHAWLLDEAAKQAAEEKAAGKPLPIPPARQAIMDQLLKSQDTIAAKNTPPITSPIGLEVTLPIAAVVAFGLWIFLSPSSK